MKCCRSNAPHRPGRRIARLAARLRPVAWLAAVVGCGWTGPDATAADAGAPPSTAHDRIFVSQAGSATIAASEAMTLSQRTEAGPYAVIFQPSTLNTTDTSLMVSVTDRRRA